MRIFLIGIFLSTSYLMSAQFGVAVKSNLNNFNSWNDYYQDNNISDRPFRNTLDLGVNYWFRLKSKRVEFLPEVTYSLKSTDNINPSLTDAFETSLSSYGFRLNTHIYFMDLENDCNCPTFSKQGSFVPKAIHLIFSPGFKYYNTTLDVDGAEFSTEASGIALNVGLGLGLDIGINNLLTITPFFLLNYSTSYSSDVFNNYTDYSCDFECDFVALEKASNFHPQFGIRIGLRPDYVKENRY